MHSKKMRTGLALMFLLAAAFYTAAQSGRMKPPDSAKPAIRTPESSHPAVRPKVVPTPPDSDDVIRVESTLVPIPVSVLDQNGLAVTNLTMQDFELRIDGKPAEISDFSRSESPIRLAMLFDNSSSVIAAREFEKNAAIKFFKRVIRPDRDLAALFSVSTETLLEQELTKNVNLLVRSIESFDQPTGATALLDGIIIASDYLAQSEGRRVIIIVSDGDDTKSDSSFDAALRAAQQANCQIYVVKTTDFENFIRTKSRVANANTRRLAAENRMQEFARQTGGSVYSPIDERELETAFRQISAELSQQYILSYYPEDDAEKRGEFRNISLAVPSRPNLSIRTRKGYYLPKR